MTCPVAPVRGAIPAVSSDPNIPRTSSGYALLRRVATGTYGTVWLARAPDGAFRAVKVVRKDRSSSPRHFEREYEGLQCYEPVSHVHPGLVQLFEVTRAADDSEFTCVMELADDALMGRDIDPSRYHPLTLREVLNHRKRLGIVDIVLLARPLLGALEALHSRGLVHRDIKPANVIFVSGRPKLADIGLVAEESDVNTCVGSIGYIAPEGSGRAAADLYSMGRMLYEMFSGVAVQTLSGPLPDLRHRLSQPRQVEFYEVVMRACAASVSDRWPSAAALLEALRPFVPQREAPATSGST